MDPFALTMIFIAMAMFAYARGRTDGRREQVIAAAKAAIDKAADEMAAAANLTQRLPEFKAPVAIGDRFRYLGLDMLCTGHSMQTTMGTVPCLKSEYVASDGTVRSAVFVGTDIDALRAEVARASAPGVAA